MEARELGRRARLGRKLDFLLGLATGRTHNVLRSQSIAGAFNSIGIYDSPAMRQYLTEHLNRVLQDQANLVRQVRGADIRESLLMGPAGGVKLESIWLADDLISVIVKKGH